MDEDAVEDAIVATPASDPSGRVRGWVSLYVVAFALLIGAGVAMGSSALGLLESTRLLWTSAILSAASIVVAIVSLVLPRR